MNYSLLPDAYLKKADEIISLSDEKDIEIHFYKEDSYPKRLHQVRDAPLVVYKKGSGKLNSQKTIGIVGTRKATKYGHRITEGIVAAAKDLNIQIISGLAYGIDVRSHKAALNGGLSTFGVLACGLDYIHSTRHAGYAKEMQNKEV